MKKRKLFWGIRVTVFLLRCVQRQVTPEMQMGERSCFCYWLI